MGDNFNTVAGWVLAAGIAALGFTILSGEYFSHEKVEHGGYEIAGGGDEGSAAEVPIAALLGKADVAKGKELFQKCSTCHTINAGGANGNGPNLHGVVGRKMGAAGGFGYSAGLMGKGGKWDFDSLNAWIKSPKGFIDGTKMSFPGMSDGQERANLIAYLNTEGSNLPLPAAPKEAAPAKEGEAKPGEAAAAEKK